MQNLENQAREIQNEKQPNKNSALRVGNFLVSLLSYIKNNLQLKIFSGTHIAQAQIDTTGSTPKASASFDETTKKFSFQFWLPKGEKGDTVVGPAGASVYRLDLDNENASIPCTHEGIPLAGIVYPNCNAKLFYGDELKPCTFTYTPDGITCNGTTAMSSNTTGILSLSAITKDVATVVVGNSITPSVSTIMTISKIYGGINGEDAVVYWLSPSVSVIKKNTEGVLFPSELSCSQLKQVGNKAVEYSTDTILKYRQLPDGDMQTYTDKVLVSSTSTGIEFSMYSPDASIVLDSETIPVLSDGKTPLIVQGEWFVNGSTTGIVAEGASTYAMKGTEFLKYNPNTQTFWPPYLTIYVERTKASGEVSKENISPDTIGVFVDFANESHTLVLTKNDFHVFTSEDLKAFFTRVGRPQGLSDTETVLIDILTSRLSLSKTLTQINDGAVGPVGPSGDKPLITSDGGTIKVDGQSVLDVGVLAANEIGLKSVLKDTYTGDIARIDGSIASINSIANEAHSMAVVSVPQEVFDYRIEDMQSSVNATWERTTTAITNASTALTNASAALAKANAALPLTEFTTEKNKINANLSIIEKGSANLLNGSDFATNRNAWNPTMKFYVDEFMDFYSELYFNDYVNGVVGQDLDRLLKLNTTYTFSALFRNLDSVARTVEVRVECERDNGTYLTRVQKYISIPANTTSWTLFFTSFSLTNPSIAMTYLFIFGPSGMNTGNLHIKKPNFNLGTTILPWGLNSQDSQSNQLLSSSSFTVPFPNICYVDGVTGGRELGITDNNSILMVVPYNNGSYTGGFTGQICADYFPLNQRRIITLQNENLLGIFSSRTNIIYLVNSVDSSQGGNVSLVHDSTLTSNTNGLILFQSNIKGAGIVLEFHKYSDRLSGLTYLSIKKTASITPKYTRTK